MGLDGPTGPDTPGGGTRTGPACHERNVQFPGWGLPGRLLVRWGFRARNGGPQPPSWPVSEWPTIRSEVQGPGCGRFPEPLSCECWPALASTGKSERTGTLDLCPTDDRLRKSWQEAVNMGFWRREGKTSTALCAGIFCWI